MNLADGEANFRNRATNSGAPIDVIVYISRDCTYLLYNCTGQEEACTPSDPSEPIEPEDSDGLPAQPASADGRAKKFRDNENLNWVSKTEFPRRMQLNTQECQAELQYIHIEAK